MSDLKSFKFQLTSNDTLLTILSLQIIILEIPPLFSIPVFAINGQFGSKA